MNTDDLTTTTSASGPTTLLVIPVPTNGSQGGKASTTTSKVSKTTPQKPKKKATTTVPITKAAKASTSLAVVEVGASPSTTEAVVGSGVDASITTVLPPDQVPNNFPDSTWLALRKCESNNRYEINTGNGYYGAYQFALGTWRKLGYAGYPHRAAPVVQDEAAKRLQAKAGWGQWPACSRKLGLR